MYAEAKILENPNEDISESEPTTQRKLSYLYLCNIVYMVLLYLKYFQPAHPKFEADTTVQANGNIENYKCNKDF